MPDAPAAVELDLVIFGGGAAGLWLLDVAKRAGYGALLFEVGDLGAGQTIASQGIIHGGLKYTLNGLFNRSARAIRAMPALWRDCLEGRRQPDLRGTRMRAASCYLWRTESLSSRVGMIGARAGLAVKPVELTGADRPAVLRDAPGVVASLDEPVIDPRSFVEVLFGRQRASVFGFKRIVETDRDTDDRWVISIESHSGTVAHIRSVRVVLTAGSGNASLREMFKQAGPKMQRRPLHMTLLRGDLPILNGHCVDGAKTRVTITSDTVSDGRTIWQIGGQVSEDGVNMTRDDLIAHVRRELEQVIPGSSYHGCEWATYRVDRAEAIMPGFKRPDDVQLIEERNVITAWPTKLALAPRLAERVVEHLPKPKCRDATLTVDGFALPGVAQLPWEAKEVAWTAAR